MRRSSSLLLALLLLTACGKKFSRSLADAEKSFAENNYIDTIDALNNGLPVWNESDGNDAKGRAYELLGKSYHRLRNTDKAIDAYQQAAALSTTTFDSSYALGNIYLVKSKPELARKSFLDALRKKPDDPLALLGLGNSCFAEKRRAEALAAFEKVLDVSPGVREAMEGLRITKSMRVRKTPAHAPKKAPARSSSQRKKR